MTRQVKVATKPDDLSSVTETHMIEVGTTYRKLFSDFTLMTWHIVYMGMHAHTEDTDKFKK